MIDVMGRGIRATVASLRVVCLCGLLVPSVDAQPAQPAADPQSVFDQAILDFANQDIRESAAGFDKLVALVPDVAPRLWQRGIVLYYAGRYDDCRAQFESHRLVNPNDVENAAWHFLCVARADSPEEARAALLPVGPDPRIPMQEVYGILSGSQTAEDVMAATGGRPSAEFYAHLYLGLYAEALGDSRDAMEHIRAAALDTYAQTGGFMHTVARVHLALRAPAR